MTIKFWHTGPRLYVPLITESSVICRAKKIFSFGIDSNLYGSIFDRDGRKASERYSRVYKMEAHCNWDELCTAAKNKSSSKDPYFSQEQVVEFCSFHADKLTLGTMTLFLVKEEERIAIFSVMRVIGIDLTTSGDMISETSTGLNGSNFSIVIPD